MSVAGDRIQSNRHYAKRYPCPKGCGKVYHKKKLWIYHIAECKGRTA